MEKSEIECCGTTHLHDSLVHQIEDGMPKEETIRELSDFFKVFGDMTRRDGIVSSFLPNR